MKELEQKIRAIIRETYDQGNRFQYMDIVPKIMKAIKESKIS